MPTKTDSTQTSIGVYRSASEVAAALAKKYDGTLKTVKGSGNKDFEYIPWNDSLRKLTEVFGPFGWDTRITHSEAHPAEGVYVAVVEVTARVIDDATGAIVTLTRAGQGRSIARPSKFEREQGMTVAVDLGTHKTAAAGAASDALSRAVKQLGDAFGLFLYEKDEDEGGEQQTYGNSPRRSSSGPSEGTKRGGATPNQRTWLLKNGFSNDDVDGMTFEQASANLDRIFGKSNNTKQQVVSDQR